MFDEPFERGLLVALLVSQHYFGAYGHVFKPDERHWVSRGIENRRKFAGHMRDRQGPQQNSNLNTIST